MSHYTNAHGIKPFTVNKTVSSILKKKKKILKTFHSGLNRNLPIL